MTGRVMLRGVLPLVLWSMGCQRSDVDPPPDTMSDSSTAALSSASPVSPLPPPWRSASRRGLWVWDSTLPADTARSEDLIRFALENGVDTLFLAADPVGHDEPGAVLAYAAVVAKAHRFRIRVLATSGWGWFTVPCDTVDADACWEDGWAIYEGIASSGVPFDGVMDDSEPYAVMKDAWDSDFETRARDTVHFREGVKDRIGTLPLHHATPAWYHDLAPVSMVAGGETATLDLWLADTVDVRAVMSYRDTAEGILAFGAEELAAATVWLGAELKNTGEGDHVDFSSEGPDVMLDELDALDALVRTDPNYLGSMIHHYDEWLTWL